MDDFLSTAKFADNSSEIQLALTLYSVGIDILFFKKAKKKKRIHHFSDWKCVGSYIFQGVYTLKKFF